MSDTDITVNNVLSAILNKYKAWCKSDIFRLLMVCILVMIQNDAINKLQQKRN